jgi:hypothetical protein
VSVTISTAALALLVTVARKWQTVQQPKRLLLTAVAAISGMGIVVDGYDHWRHSRSTELSWEDFANTGPPWEIVSLEFDLL